MCTSQSSDQQLLATFREQRREAAFTELYQRHAPLVFGVCRQVLHDAHLAQDAASAVFLVLAKEAGPMSHDTRPLGPWLHRVATHVARNVARRERRRLAREQAVGAAATSQPADDREAELRARVHAEIDRLPAKYRAVIVLHHLEGQSHEAAAAALRLSYNTFVVRLKRGRELLAKRLRTGSDGEPTPERLTALLLLPAVALPPELLTATVNQAVALATGKTLAGSAAVIMKGYLKMLFWTQVKTVAALSAAAVVLGSALPLAIAVARATNAAPQAVPAEPPANLAAGKALPAPPTTVAAPEPDPAAPPPATLPMRLDQLITLHVSRREYVQAEALLDQAFRIDPYAPFRDSLLLKAALVAHGAGDLAKARERCRMLLRDYPQSPYADQAKAVLRRSATPLPGAAPAAAAAAGQSRSPGAAPEPTPPVADGKETILRLPYMRTPPRLDGIVGEKEWADAAAITGFTYNLIQGHYAFLAPVEIQTRVCLAYDNANLYLCFRSPIFPEQNAASEPVWLRAEARFPDVVSHPVYGLERDDHYQLELRPGARQAKAGQGGCFKWHVNCLGTVADQYLPAGGGSDFSYSSRATIRSRADGISWTVEMAIPLTAFRYGDYDGSAAPTGQPGAAAPPPETVFRAWFARGLGAIAADNAGGSTFGGYAGNKTETALVLDPNGVSCQLDDLGPLMDDQLDLTVTLKNHDRAAGASQTVRLGFFVENERGIVYSSTLDPKLTAGQVVLGPGEAKTIRLHQQQLGISMTGNRFWFDVCTVGDPAKAIFRTPPTPFHATTARLYGTNVSLRQRLEQDFTRLRAVQPAPSPRELVNLKIPVAAAQAPIAQALLTIVAAQQLYRHLDWNLDGQPAYARGLRGTNSLYEIVAGRADLALIPADLALAEANGDNAKAFNGYWFRVLPAPGAAAGGGEKNHLPAGVAPGPQVRLPGGFGLLAFPDTYEAGRKCYLADQDGQLFEADLGANTLALARKIERFDPAPAQGWRQCPLPPPGD